MSVYTVFKYWGRKRDIEQMAVWEYDGKSK